MSGYIILVIVTIFDAVDIFKKENVELLVISVDEKSVFAGKPKRND